ncbi:MAG: NAD-dependent epimerase/dehydratase family protein [Caldilineae bacterium]|nr:MAG: NAD-dependent epimerase/dehydratase family protein [Caldilineae bacterium]
MVYHAAAYKHVYWMERFPLQAVRTNILGAHYVHEAAHRFGAERFILISTDKAVAPSSVMGATKRFCELLILSCGKHAAHPNGPHPSLHCTGVRFGNVVGSRGSVVPTFERQIAAGGPVTVTDPKMRRYFMSVEEAVSLVLAASTLTQGGDLFMLDMGEEVSIMDLATRMIRLRGLRPQNDIPIVFSGPKPGEKLAEDLLAEDEHQEPTAQPGVFRIVSPVQPDPAVLHQAVAMFQAYVQQENVGDALHLLWSSVAEVRSDGESVSA